MGTNSHGVSYCQWGFTGFPFSGEAFATTNAMGGEQAHGCKSEQVLVLISPISLPAAGPSAPHAQLGDLNHVPPSFFALWPPFAPFCQTCPFPQPCSVLVPPAPPCSSLHLMLRILTPLQRLGEDSPYLSVWKK